MRGAREHAAKALVLGTLRIAHAEQRRRLLYVDGGSREILEHELDLSSEGIAGLLGLSFGGADAEGVLLQVLERVKTEAWRTADILVVSGGGWPGSAILCIACRNGGLPRQAADLRSHDDPH